MDNQELLQFIGKDNLTVSEAMQRIDTNSYGILFLTDDDGKIRGCITDGDIRRFLLSGGKMSGMAVEAANKNPRVADSIEEARHLYHKRNYVVIPLVDKYGKIIDVYFGETGTIIQKKHNSLNIPVVINAGGKGTRLDPFTRVLPKPLIPKD